MKTVLNLKKNWRRRFEQDLEDVPGARHAKAASWYYCTYHPDERMNDNSLEGKLLSFPWVMDDVICEIAMMNNNRVATEDQAKPIDDALVRRLASAKQDLKFTMIYSSDEEDADEEDEEGSGSDGEEDEETDGNEEDDREEEDATSQDIWLEIQNSIKNCNLIEEETDKLTDLLWRYQDVFGVDYKDLTQTSILEFHVDTGDAKPIMHRPNRFMSHAELDQLRQEINEMVQQGILIPATHVKGPEGQRAGGWSFPARRRLYVQFQKLNEVTVRDPWPLPVISDILESYNQASHI
ncbi:hypothetical protein BDC45DRAFT_498815, partial [Circinella umbellata]